jgi:hypothetical protein
MDPGDAGGWLVRCYGPGQSQDQWKEVDGALARAVVDACHTQHAETRINWDDGQALRELYWEYRR